MDRGDAAHSVVSRLDAPNTRWRVRALVIALIVGISVITLANVWSRSAAAGTTARTTPVYDPPVLAGQMALEIWCSGGVYGRHGDQIVLTTSGHCSAPDGSELTDAHGVAGVWGPISNAATCAHPGYRCTASDMRYLIVAPDRIPWGHLNEIDLGAGGYRFITPDTKPLECEDIAVGDALEFNGRRLYRTGRVLLQREYLVPIDQDPNYFPCIVVADIRAWTGDSGGVVFVNGIPSGIASRRFGDLLGFTPLGSGLEELGVTLCDMPNCGLTPP
jgi:hypothetical protein